MIFLLCLLLALLLPISSPWPALLVIAGCLLELVEIALLRHWSHRLNRRLPAETGAEAMVGSLADVVTACAPSGTVRVRGELWEAHCDAGAAAGTTVRIEQLDDLVLVVSPAASGRRRRRR